MKNRQIPNYFVSTVFIFITCIMLITAGLRSKSIISLNTFDFLIILYVLMCTLVYVYSLIRKRKTK